MNGGGVTALLISLLLYHAYGGDGDFSWQKFDHFDDIDARFIAVQKHNCRNKDKNHMVFRNDTVSQIPKYNQLLSKVFYKNRTSLLNMHNMALNRAMYFSYILQKMNTSKTYDMQPNWMYMYMSVTADVNANPYMMNGSAIYFDKDCHYPNWYTTVFFNNTLPYFAPKAWRWDDTKDQDNFMREPTRRVVMVSDIGSGINQNYTHPGYKMNPWYDMWLPDRIERDDSLKKFTYSVGIKYSNVTGKFTKDEFEVTNFFGPNSPGAKDKLDKLLPVRFTEPYYDCGKSNKWIVSAVAPIVDFMPRYSNWTHLRRQRFIGAIVMDIDFNQIDFNACGTSLGNPAPSYLGGVARCKGPSTMCKHKSGFGFKRGGYVCVCKPSWRYPLKINPPYQGVDLEQATKEEYDAGFDCSKVQFLTVLPQLNVPAGISIEVEFGPDGLNTGSNQGSLTKRSVDDVEGGTATGRKLLSFNSTETLPNLRTAKSKNLNAAKSKLKTKVAARYSPVLNTKTQEKKVRKLSSRHKRSSFDAQSFGRAMRILRHKASVNRNTCKTRSASQLYLPGDVAYGVDVQFISQATTALRLAHFLSNFLQNANVNENFGYLRGGGRLYQDHIFGEVLANVMSDHNIISSGVFYERYRFDDNGTNKEFFGPLAYRRDGTFNAIDSAGLSTRYTSEDWFGHLRQRWNTNFKDLPMYKMRPMMRSNPNGTSTVPFEYIPVRYRAPSVTDGFWTRPTFKCDGRIDDWVVTYAVPFFGLDSLRTNLRFYGVVTVDVPLSGLEINQCAQPFYIANAFKNTARCDYASTKCGPLAGFRFTRGSYRCLCREGFEYPFRDGKFWIEGSLIELEWEKKKRGLFSRFDSLKCRIAAGSNAKYSLSAVMMGILISLFCSSW